MDMKKHPNIEYETQIIQQIRKDNVNKNTVHFVWDRAPDGFSGDYILNVVTHSLNTRQNFLLKTVNGSTKRSCFVKMLAYVTEKFQQDNNYTVTWKRRNKPGLNTSYFRGKHEDEVRAKFYHDCNGEVVSIKKSPIA
jgi:hypothetical protein